jgi:putative transposase
MTATLDAAADRKESPPESAQLLTEASGHVEIDVPRNRDGSFEPPSVRKRQRRLSEVDEIVLLLYAKGLTTGEISAHFEETYGASVSKETVSPITDPVLAEMADWSVRPLDEIYAAVFLDAGDAMEASPQRLLDHLRRPLPAADTY